MAKTVIFNNQVYELDENKLAPINASIVEFLTTELAGTGATIKFNNAIYEVDGTKLSTSKSELVNFLGTIEGEGEVIKIDGIEYSVASSALEEANVTVAETLVNLSAFSEGLEYELNADGASYSVIGIGTCTDTDVVIPMKYEGLPVTELKTRIGWAEEKGELIETEVGTFQGCSNLTSVTIPNGVTSIGYSAFNYCTSLTHVTIPNSVTSIGDSAFYSCSSLTSVTIPDSVTSISWWAFLSCDSLTSVHITDIAAWCAIDFDNDSANPLYHAKNLYLNGTLVTDLEIPNIVTNIGYSAFENCDSLTSVTIPDGVTSIGGWAFSNCTNLTSVTIGNGVTSIGNYAFTECTSLTDIYINKDTDSIADAPWGASNAKVHWNSTAESEDELAGTWVFNDQMTLWYGNYLCYDSGLSDSEYYFTFESNGVAYDAITCWLENIGVEGQIVYNEYSNVWYDTAYQTITITSNLADVVDKDGNYAGDALLAWLQANATKQSSSAVPTISFTIDGTSYQAEEGMTWADFCGGQEMPTEEMPIYIGGSTIVYYACDSEGNYTGAGLAIDGVTPSDLIVSGTNYVTISSPGGSGH